MKNEICLVLRGRLIATQRRTHFYLAYTDPRLYFAGRPTQVDFDYQKVYAAEDAEPNVIGFWHTHPGLPARPSAQDAKTMRGWAKALGKDLLCIIEGGDRTRGFLVRRDARVRAAEVFVLNDLMPLPPRAPRRKFFMVTAYV